ncbi:MAG: phosphate ABC transporter permease subunit PstC [Thermodesulfobacteriaceae bacterium]|nr:phosphate ABC transporter permease subunit PstC [Thermodesulfobacteriaceae bacterium]MCX8040954.1 phosphate ABC transporter permease subunit PstC [Thermodesulfobacteriaceae bacterium]MDW8135690.1 phosphate ABC transporter permease subunit PstC [Thermodesulfobacterium sp.]
MTSSFKREIFFNLAYLIITFLASFIIIFLALGIFLVLFKEAYPAIKTFGFLGFLLSTEWDPVKEVFGAAPSLIGTLITSLLALTIAVPTALGIAIFINEVAPSFLKDFISTGIELLAAIPSIIYGMWGLFTLAPLMAKYIEPFLQETIGKLPLIGKLFEGTPLGIDLLTASVILSIMIIPFTASVARDSLALTPPVLKESAYAIGATKWEVIKDVMLPYSKLGIIGGIGLSLGRALGETMAVAFVLGNVNKIPTSLLEASTTVTVKLANEFTEADKDIHLASLFYLALLLFIMSFFILALAKLLFLKIERR